MTRAAACVAALVAAIAPVRAEPLTSEPAASTTAAAEAPAGPPRGFAIGVELGEPTSVTAAWFTDQLGISGALGTGTLEGAGLQLHADLQLVVARLTPAMPLRLGLGGRYYRHGYELMSFDEIPDTHYGLRASAAIAYEHGPLQLYAEVAPGVDVKRTQSCTLASGPNSICPHAQESPLFMQLVVGARWFLSR